MSFQAIRATFEAAISSAYAGLSPAVPVVFDNVQETPPELPHVLVSLSYTDTTTPVLCPDEAAMEQIRGSITISCYAKRGQGMKQLEELSAVAMQTLVQLKDICNEVRATVGTINGPSNVLSGNAPYALASVTAPFTAKGTSGTIKRKLTTRQVKLTNPTVRETDPTTKDVALTQPVSGLTTQEDANQYFAENIPPKEIDGQDY